MVTSLRDTPLIARSTLFGNPKRGGCQISPCGRWIAFAAPADGVMNLWVCERGPDVVASLSDARQITFDSNRGIYQFFWAYDRTHVLYLQDENGDENEHLFAVPASGGAARDLTPIDGAKARVQSVSRKLPTEILVAINDRDARFEDLYRIALDTGARTLVQENTGFFGFVTDDDYSVRLALRPGAAGGAELQKPVAGEWVTWRAIPADDFTNTSPAALHADGETLYMLDSRNRDTAALISYKLDGDPDAGTVIGEHPRADVAGIWTDLETHAPIAWTAIAERREIHVLSDRLRSDVDYLNTKDLGEWRVGSRTEDDAIWIVAASTDVSPTTFYLYVRATQSLTKLYDLRPELSGIPLARMQHTTIKSRDGLDLVVYLTIPPNADVTARPFTSTQPLPLVLHVHGGPQARDTWGFDPYHQWLANRGYAVLSVNFRASTGFGKAFIAAGNGEWGGKMDADLVDAVQWAIGLGVADPRRVCIMGASYGGYATLWGMTAHPDLYACGVDIVGPSNLETLASSIPPYWEAAKKLFFAMVGDPASEQDRLKMRERSPVHRAGKIAKPLLIGQGANDPRVKQAESDQMVAAMRANDVPVTYILFPDEGHGFYRPVNNIYFNAITERFLEKYLGGRSQPLEENEVDGNTALLVENSLQ